MRIVPLHRVKFSWGNGVQIELEWSKGSGRQLSELPDAPHLVEAEEEVGAEEPESVPALCWRDRAPVLFERFQFRENTEYFVDVTLPISLQDAVVAHQKCQSWPFDGRLSHIFKPDPVRRWKTSSDGTLTASGRLRLRNHAGILDLSVTADASLICEVVCRKIGYLEEFRALLDAVAEESADLLLQYDSPVSASFNLADILPETEAALLFQLRHIMSERNLPVALDEVRRHMHVGLVQRQTIQEVSSVEDADFSAFVEEFEPSNMVEGGPFARLFRGYSPREFPAVEVYETTDTPENRYLKAFIEELRLVAYRLAASLKKTGRNASLREVNQWLEALDEELSSDVWRPVGQLRSFPSNSQVLQKRQGYRDIFKLDMALRMSLELPWKRAEALADGLIGDIRPVSELYEYWCLFLLRRSIAELSQIELPTESSMVVVSDGGLQVRLQRGRRSRISYLFRSDEEKSLRINLFYNRAFPRPTNDSLGWHGSYTARFDPDYSIELILETDAGKQRHWLHFDAKYRMERGELDVLFAEAGGDLEQEPPEPEATDYEREIIRVHKREDLFKMHTYRDGILGSRGAYILFPGDRVGVRFAGDNQNLFVRHPTSFVGGSTYCFPSVGAFDLCPGRDVAQLEVLRTFLRSVFEKVYQGASYCEETGLFASF